MTLQFVVKLTILIGAGVCASTVGIHTNIYIYIYIYVAWPLPSVYPSHPQCPTTCECHQSIRLIRMVGRLNPAAISIARHGTKNLLCKVHKHQVLHQRTPHSQKSMSILSLWKLQYYKDTNITNLPPAHLVGSHVLMPWLPTRQLFLLRLGWTTWSPHGFSTSFSQRFAAKGGFSSFSGSSGRTSSQTPTKPERASEMRKVSVEAAYQIYEKFYSLPSSNMCSN